MSQDIQTSPADEVFTKDELLALSQVNELRGKLIQKLVGDQVDVPMDTSSKAMLVQLIDGVERSTMNKAKLRIANNAANSEADVRAVIAQALAGKRVYKAAELDDADFDVPDHISKAVDIVPGELDQGVILLTSKDLKANS